MDNMSERTTWIIFELERQLYGIQSTLVREMVVLGNIDRLPHSPSHIRGVTTRRDNSVLAVDLRKWLSMDSKLQEHEKLIEILNQREQDHVNWLNELKNSVQEKREFKLTTDPHACAFGKWYDNYQTDHIELKLQLDKFDRPHKKIHGIAIEVRKFIKQEQHNQAMKLIDSTWSVELALMRKLFNRTRQLLKENTNEIIIITENHNRLTGFIVDSVEEVRNIDPDSIIQPDENFINKTEQNTLGIAKFDNKMCILLETESLYSEL